MNNWSSPKPSALSPRLSCKAFPTPWWNEDTPCLLKEGNEVSWTRLAFSLALDDSQWLLFAFPRLHKPSLKYSEACPGFKPAQWIYKWAHTDYSENRNNSVSNLLEHSHSATIPSNINSNILLHQILTSNLGCNCWDQETWVHVRQMAFSSNQVIRACHPHLLVLIYPRLPTHGTSFPVSLTETHHLLSSDKLELEPSARYEDFPGLIMRCSLSLQAPGEPHHRN